MKKLFFFTPIILLIFATTLTKNSTKKLDKEIFQLKENIRILEDRYELTLLDYNILTSPKKLMEYQQYYFQDKFEQKKLENLNEIEFLSDKLKIDKMSKINDNVIHTIIPNSSHNTHLEQKTHFIDCLKGC